MTEEKQKQNWCPKCLAAAEAFLVPQTLDAQTRKYGAHSDGYLLARGTGVELRVPKWRQETSPNKKAIIWERNDKLGVSTSGSYYNERHQKHVTISNLSSRSHRAAGLPLCTLDPDVFGLTGPGADEHIAADAEVIAKLDAEEDVAKRTKARHAATSAEADALARQIADVLRTLNIEAEPSSPKELFSAEPRDAKRYYVRLSLDAAARVVAALGGMVGSLPAEPMPLWRVRYGDDGNPIYVAARTRAGVITHMLATYCHERHDDGTPNIPLKPELLRIEEAGPDPELPAKPVVAA